VDFLPISAKAQSQGNLINPGCTYRIIVFGTISEVDGTGSSLPGFSMGTKATITITGNDSDIELIAGNGGTSAASGYIDTKSVDSFTGSAGTIVLQGVQFDVIDDSVGIDSGDSALSVDLPPNLVNGVNGFAFVFAKGAITTTAWDGGATTLLSRYERAGRYQCTEGGQPFPDQQMRVFPTPRDKLGRCRAAILYSFRTAESARQR